MRPLKYRQWTGEKFVYWGFIDGGFIGPASGGGLAGESFNPMTTPHEQFTGLHDKNGREIYEGDLLKYEMGSIWEVLFEEGCFKRNSLTVRYGIKKLLRDAPEQFEIIGNIYQNPELGVTEGKG